MTPLYNAYTHHCHKDFVYFIRTLILQVCTWVGVSLAISHSRLWTSLGLLRETLSSLCGILEATVDDLQTKGNRRQETLLFPLCKPDTCRRTQLHMCLLVL